MTMTRDEASSLTTAQIAAMPVWLFQYSPRSARALQLSWNAGEDFEYPALDRHADDIRLDDIVLFWRSGRGDTAGLIGFGVASGVIEELSHPRNYQDPDGPRALRKSAEAALCCVFDEPVITRSELKQSPEFADFDLFRMPNRANAFEVTAAQWAIVRDRIEEVMGR